MIEIQIAQEGDLEHVVAFYNKVIEQMADAPHKPGWKKDVYPTREDVRAFIVDGWFLMANKDGEMVGGLALTVDRNAGYHGVPWLVEAAPDDVFVIHGVGVLPTHHGQGIAQQLLGAALQVAKERKKKAVRLDVLENHLPAQALYRKVGFQYIDTVRLYYADTGLASFQLYEYPL